MLAFALYGHVAHLARGSTFRAAVKPTRRRLPGAARQRNARATMAYGDRNNDSQKPVLNQTTDVNDVSATRRSIADDEGDVGRRPVNRLASEKSPYLLQHKHNPVDWFPWGEEAFEKARKENKVIFLSVGYSTCHWCHVMERECFENDEIAVILNDSFVSVKLDREERPDVDSVYMTFIQATSGNGGWPMNVFLTPKLLPFVGATYIPPDRLRNALMEISSRWNAGTGELERQGEKMTSALQEFVAQTRADADTVIDRETMRSAINSAREMFDAEDGGFGSAPKFARPSVFELLFGAHVMLPSEHAGGGSSQPDVAAAAVGGRPPSALDMATVTLRRMALGGVYDQLGGGFHRYSVDKYWHVPHFEKMLYDQSQLIMAYLQAYQLTGEALFAHTARGVLEYVKRDMLDDATAAFYSAEDADSEVPFAAAASGGQPGSVIKREGAYYVWTEFEMRLVLGERLMSLAEAHYGVRSEGNTNPNSDPHGELEGQNVLRVAVGADDLAASRRTSVDEVQKSLREINDKLFRQRSTRPKPHLDDKIITQWNSMMVCAFARAAMVLDDERYAAVAERTASFLREVMWTGECLLRTYRDGASPTEGFAEDYVTTIAAALDMFTLTGDDSWVDFALKLQSVLDAKFWDEEHGGCYSTRQGDGEIIFRKKEDYDSSEPAASSVAAANLLRLAALTGEDEYRRRAERTARAFSLVLKSSAFSLPMMVSVAVAAIDGARRVVISGDMEHEDTREMVREFHRHCLPYVALLRAPPQGCARPELFGKETADMCARDGLATAYVCVGRTCQKPTTSLDEFRSQLGQLVKLR